MSVNIIDKGTYEIFETTKNNRLLVLNNKDYYAWISTPLGNFLVGSNSDHQKASTVQRRQQELIDAAQKAKQHSATSRG